jgi:hypothetical protein
MMTMGGTSDAEGDGYECVISFKDEMKEVEIESFCFDANEIESGKEVDDNDAFVCEVKDDSSLEDVRSTARLVSTNCSR